MQIRAPSLNNEKILNRYIPVEDGREYDTLDQLDFGFPRMQKMGPDMMVNQIADYIGPVLANWSNINNRILVALKRLPRSNVLIIRTHEIESKLDEIARFVCVPNNTLNRGAAHSHKGTKTVDVLRNTNIRYLEKMFAEHCTPLMDRFFPGYRLTYYLEGKKPQQ